MPRRIDVHAKSKLTLEQTAQLQLLNGLADEVLSTFHNPFFIVTDEGIPDFWEMYTYLVEVPCFAF